MVKTRRLGRRYFAVNGALMMGLGITASVLASLMANPESSQLAYAIAVVLSASCLLFTSAQFSIVAYRERLNSPLTRYITVALLSVVCWVILWLVRSAPTDLHLLDLMAGLQGALWALWYVRLASYLKATPRAAVLLCILAATTSFIGIVLATQSQLTELASVSLFGPYMMLTGIETLLATMYLYRHFDSEAEMPAQRIPAPSEAFIANDSRAPGNQGLITQAES
jgi:hypothetical protein